MTLKLNISLIYLLELLRKGTNNPKELRKKIKLSKLQFHNLLKDLKNLDYIDENGDVLKFKENTKSILYRDIANKYDVQKILHDSNESIFCELTEYKTKTEIQGKTGLSLRTIERAITEMKSIGIIIISKDTKKIMINKDKDEKLYLFAKNIKTEQRKNIESYAEIIYQDSLRILKKIPKGKFAKGELSGFSMFSSYGVEYVTSYDYYIEQNTPLKLEEIVIHAILISDKNKDKNDLCMSIIFYLKNKDSFDPLKIRETARNYKISGIWLDIESYLRNTEVTNPSLFLPWNEFEEKSKLYDILPEQYLLPEAYPDLFKDIGKKLTTKIEIYILGGENMRIKKLKSRTRDCDLVVNDKKSYENIVNILMAMGYNIKRSLQLDDRRIEPLEILIHPERSRIDLFVQVIAGKMYLSEGMKNRAEISNYGNLNVGLLSNEDVFLLKSITAREGDIQDMANLALTSNFQWKIILDELDAQEEKTRKNFSELVLESLDDLYEQRGISSHLYKKLEKKVLDYKIREQIIKGNSSIGKIVELLKGKFISEKKIRNRINYLQRINYLKKNQKNLKLL